MTHFAEIFDPSDAPPGTAMAPRAPSAPPAPVIEGAGSITSLLHLAVQRGTPVAELRELVALHDQMAQRQARQEFAQAMAAFQHDCPPIKHERTAKIVTRGGGDYSYTYAELDVIARVVNPILARHGLSYRWDTVVDGNTLTCLCIVSHVGGHSETTRFGLPVDNPSAMSAQQKVGAALTFAQRRSLSAALGITTTDDDTDGADDPTPVNADQVTAIEDLIEETGANRARFLKFMRVDAVVKIPAARYGEAVNALKEIEEKRRART